MIETPQPITADLDEAQLEIARLNKIVRVLMDRAERSTSVQTSDFSLFQTTIMLEKQVRHRTVELQAALHENERINSALRERADAEQRMLRESEQRLRALLQNCSDMITVVARDGTVLYQAGAVRSVLGHEPCELEGSDLARWVDDVERPHLVELCHTTRPASATLHLRHANGLPRTCEVLAVNLIGHPSWDGVILNIRDVTDRQQLELELRLAQKLESIGQLAAGIAHEINTPIQFVSDSIGFLDGAFTDLDRLQQAYTELRAAAAPDGVDAELLARVETAEDTADLEYLRQRVPQAIARCVDGLARVATIVKAMRAFAHPVTSTAEPVDVNEAVQTTLVVAASEYRHVADVELELDQVPPALANTGDFNQVILNLIVNAGQAITGAVGDSGRRGTITINTSTADADVVITVADTGGGIPADIVERVFDPFFTTKEVGRGTGQGLAIARTIVARHHGQINLQTEPGSSTTFTIRLPIAVADRA